jgi:hypothetical protein
MSVKRFIRLTIMTLGIFGAALGAWKQKVDTTCPLSLTPLKRSLNLQSPALEAGVFYVGQAHSRMSAIGTKRTSCDVRAMSAFGGKADIALAVGDVRF